ncbi:MFS family transporter [Candidatus Blochmanniella floridana]|uniref:MFS family transporter n=1 Tax=Blochmanniella floridana TaxID=203907 RepID=Q7VRH7_BLOFL|nr:MFS family transporter [Candidatus Blochmannia floridanus]
MHNNVKISHTKFPLILTLNIIFILRMSGIFMALPILPVYAKSLQGSCEYLIGISIGIYGITQIIFQLPFGLISDKIGRKPIVIIGLIISVIGNELIAIAHEIWSLIIGRALQGLSAIGSVLIALLLESIQEKHHMQAMAIVGISFGITFIGSIIAGPFIANKFGFHGLFHIITIITILTILLVHFTIPTTHSCIDKNINLFKIFNDIKLIITHSELLKLNFHIFCLHTVLILNFLIWPKIITNLGYLYNVHYKIYAAVILTSIFISFPCIFLSHIKKHRKKMLIIAVNILFLSELIMFITIHNFWLFLFSMQLFFVSFNLIESILPYLINKTSPTQYKGTSISIYSIGQFLGVGLGGIVGGFLLEIQDIWLVFLFILLLTAINILINTKLQQPY